MNFHVAHLQAYNWCLSALPRQGDHRGSLSASQTEAHESQSSSPLSLVPNTLLLISLSLPIPGVPLGSLMGPGSGLFCLASRRQGLSTWWLCVGTLALAQG